MRFPLKFEKNRKFDVVGFGANSVDFLIQVPEYPAFDSKIELTEYKQSAGGEVATTMTGLQRLGLKTSYVGRFGGDAAGDFGLQKLREEGVDVSSAEQIEGARTQTAFIIIEECSGERTITWKRDEKLQYRENECSDEIASIGKVLHITPHDTKVCFSLARRAKSENTIVSIDIDNVYRGLNGLLSSVDILVSSSDFPEKLLGIKEKDIALRELKMRFGCALVGLTLGKRGSLLYCDGRFIETAGFEVPGGCKDTTGAGDSFRSGLLYGLIKGATVEESARMANAVAALKCREVGARTALPNESELKKILEQQ